MRAEMERETDRERAGTVLKQIENQRIVCLGTGVDVGVSGRWRIDSPERTYRAGC